MVGHRLSDDALIGPGWAGLILSHDEHEMIGFFGSRFQLSILHSTPSGNIDFGRWVVGQNRHLSSRLGVPEFFRQADNGKWAAFPSIIQSLHPSSMP